MRLLPLGLHLMTFAAFALPMGKVRLRRVIEHSLATVRRRCVLEWNLWHSVARDEQCRLPPESLGSLLQVSRRSGEADTLPQIVGRCLVLVNNVRQWPLLLLCQRPIATRRIDFIQAKH